MNRIAPDVDQLMWLVAEHADPSAISEFEARFPDLRLELARRVTMVRGLKGARGIESRSSIPVFYPSNRTTSPQVSRGRFAIGALALAGLAAASFVATRSMTAPAVQPPPPPTHVNTNPIDTVDRTTKYREADKGPPVIAPNESPNRTPVVQSPPPPDQPEYVKPMNVKMEQVHLIDVLKAVTIKSGLKLVVAEGMPNPEITVDYVGKTGIEILKDLGKRYTFTPFEQGDGSVIVVPAVDPVASNDATSSGPRRRIGG